MPPTNKIGYQYFINLSNDFLFPFTLHYDQIARSKTKLNFDFDFQSMKAWIASVCSFISPSSICFNVGKF